MSGNYRTSWNDDSQASETELLGGTDQTKIGNTNDRLKVDTGFTKDTQDRVRIVENNVQYEAYFVNTDHAAILNKKETTGGTVTRNTGINAMELKTTTASGSRAALQTPYIHYIAGQTVQIGITAVLGTTDTNCRKRIGYFDDADGIYLEYDGTNLSFNIRNSATGGYNQTVNASSFNQTVFTFDPTKYSTKECKC